MQPTHTFLLLSIVMMFSLMGCASRPHPTSAPPSTSLPTAIPASLPVLETVRGTFGNQIGILEDSMPRANSEKYVIPTIQEQEDFAALTATLLGNDLTGAAALAHRNNYGLSYYVDRGDDYAVSYLLREQKPIEKGWGLYAFRVDSTSQVIIEAPHPLYDKRTPTVALDLYRALDARALLIAGAHRNANRGKSADVAHATQSIFQSVHIALAEEIQTKPGDVIILQIHGFHSTKHEGYPEVVFGLGENPLPKEVAIAEKIKEALATQGIRAGICAGLDSNLQDLCARTNVQSSVTNEGSFIHIEIDEKLRRDDKAFVAALVQALSQ
jgi:hypothetical protein